MRPQSTLSPPVPAPDPTEARYAGAPARAGLYESFYLKACHPEQPRGVWIRYTVHKRPGAAPTGSLWFTLFDRYSDGPTARKTTLPAPAAGGGDWIRVGEASMRPGAAAGGVDGVDWELRFDGPGPPLFHLPGDWMYRAPLPRTKAVTVVPAARFEGRVTIDGRAEDLGGWRGMVGHNWGAQHAERWIWLHGLTSGEDWLDVVIGKVRLGPLTTPWIASGALALGGVRHRLGGPGRGLEVHEAPDGCGFMLSGRGLRVRGSVEAPRKDVVGWVYADPNGGEHHALNCSVCDMHLRVEDAGAQPTELVVRGGAAYELGLRERDHGIPIQPYPDG
jgi:hypothetical protein